MIRGRLTTTLIVLSTFAAAMLAMLPAMAGGLVLLLKYGFGSLPVVIEPLVAALSWRPSSGHVSAALQAVADHAPRIIGVSLASTALCIASAVLVATRPARCAVALSILASGAAALCGGMVVAALLAPAIGLECALLWQGPREQPRARG